jgi:hypothetical protein
LGRWQHGTDGIVVSKRRQLRLGVEVWGSAGEAERLVRITERADATAGFVRLRSAIVPPAVKMSQMECARAVSEAVAAASAVPESVVLVAEGLAEGNNWGSCKKSEIVAEGTDARSGYNFQRQQQLRGGQK